MSTTISSEDVWPSSCKTTKFLFGPNQYPAKLLFDSPSTEFSLVGWDAPTTVYLTFNASGVVGAELEFTGGGQSKEHKEEASGGSSARALMVYR